MGARDDDPGGGAAAAAGSVKIGFWEKRSVMIGIRTRTVLIDNLVKKLLVSELNTIAHRG